MELSTSSAGLTLAGEDDVSSAKVYAAKAAGYKFIELRLKPEANIQGSGRMTGAYILDVFPAGVDKNNIPRFDFSVRGGDIQFAFDKTKYAMIAIVLDDDKPGTVSQKGYNRDLIASHIDMFEVPEDVREDIEYRVSLIKAAAAKNVVQTEPDPELYAEPTKEIKEPKEATVSDLDEQIRKLNRARANKLREMGVNDPPPEPKKAPPAKAKKKSNRAPMSEEAKKAFGENMKAKREQKKLEREEAEKAKTPELKEVPVAEHEATSEVAAA